VIILSASQEVEDILQAYNSYANCYLVKPDSFDELIHLVGRLEQFWFNTAALPND
jgi:two-component system, chemotaxis family, response regulator Rcp1